MVSFWKSSESETPLIERSDQSSEHHAKTRSHRPFPAGDGLEAHIGGRRNVAHGRRLFVRDRSSALVWFA